MGTISIINLSLVKDWIVVQMVTRFLRGEREGASADVKIVAADKPADGEGSV